jgi:hypothetical protein
MKVEYARWRRAACAAAVMAWVASPVWAQQNSPLAQGSWIIAGSAGFSSSHVDGSDQSVTSLHVSPTALTFVRQRLAIGGSAVLGYSSSPNGHFTTYGLGPSARYYFGDPAGQLFPFISASVFPVWTKASDVRTSSSSGDITTRYLSLDGSVGLTRLVATHVGLTGEAYYTHLDTKVDLATTSNIHGSYDFGLRFGLTVFVH